jgi:hypothetical protein
VKSFPTLIALALGLCLTAALTGCSSQQTAQFQADEATLAAKAQTTLDAAQAQLDLAERVVTAYRASLAALPANDPARKATEQSLARASAVLVQAKLYVLLARVGFDVLAPPPPAPPATTAPAPPVGSPPPEGQPAGGVFFRWNV